MLLKFSSPDMLNSNLVDVQTGARFCKIVTQSLSPSTRSSSPSSIPVPIISTNPEELPPPPTIKRKTHISDASGSLVAQILWNGRRPMVTIGREIVGGVDELFDVTSTRISTDLLSIRSRFDTDFVWTATPDTLTLNESDQTKGTFHQNVIRVPTSPTLLHTRIPGMGHNYLEFEECPRAESFEIVVSFLIMEILRRGRFADCLTPYTFERPKFWRLKEAQRLLRRRFRRNTF